MGFGLFLIDLLVRLHAPQLHQNLVTQVFGCRLITRALNSLGQHLAHA